MKTEISEFKIPVTDNHETIFFIYITYITDLEKVEIEIGLFACLVASLRCAACMYSKMGLFSKITNFRSGTSFVFVVNVITQTAL